MIFQVSKDGKIMFQTECQECLPSDDEIKAIKKAGYRVKMKGDNEYDRRKE